MYCTKQCKGLAELHVCCLRAYRTVYVLLVWGQNTSKLVTECKFDYHQNFVDKVNVMPRKFGTN